MPAGPQVELVAVPGADDVHVGVRPFLPAAGHVLVEDFLDTGENAPLADRPAHVRAVVLVGIEAVADTEHANLDLAAGDHLAAAILELALLADIDQRHRRLTPPQLWA